MSRNVADNFVARTRDVSGHLIWGADSGAQWILLFPCSTCYTSTILSTEMLRRIFESVNQSTTSVKSR
jgi:hypothetical protein